MFACVVDDGLGEEFAAVEVDGLGGEEHAVVSGHEGFGLLAFDFQEAADDRVGADGADQVVGDDLSVLPIAC